MGRSRSTCRLTEEEKKIRRREQKKRSIRRVRAKMTQAELEERRRKDRERYQKKKEQGFIKTIKDLNPREQRQIRKLWREKAKKKREKEKIRNSNNDFVELNTTIFNTSSSTPSQSRASKGKQVAARNRRLLKSENVYLKKRIRELESKLSKYRMRSLRISQLKEGKKKKLKENREEKRVYTIKKAVHDFLLSDENSRSTSGKKDTITRMKIKKQIRFLNDSLLNLHKTFRAKTGLQISYETFRRYRPFWVLFPKVQARNTCLCALHTNTNFLVQALYHAKIISFISATDLIKSLCCNNILNVNCLERTCLTCKNKIIESCHFNDDDTISYERWITKDVTVIIKGTARKCKKTIKERVQTTKIKLFEKLNLSLPVFMKHVANMLHQIKTIQYLKEHISPADGLLHIDFSENYNCKYGAEIQSAHFGGSKAQLSLHNSVFYSTESEPPNNFLKTTSFCTVSENLRHDPVLICVHLQALTARIKELTPNLKHLHILSDGPSTQYRNKSMFNLIATYISAEFGVDTITWHYSETGHGKGAPDGVGACVKRACDSYVAKGNDVSNLEELLTCVSANIKRVEVCSINEVLISKIQKTLDTSVLRPFKGTRKIHQLAWSIIEPNVIHARRLSCLICNIHVKCPHYELGQINVRYEPIEMHTIDDSNNLQIESDTPDALDNLESPSTSATPNNPESPSTSAAPDNPERSLTPDASTMSISPGFSDRLTPDETTDHLIQNSRPAKRNRVILESGDSDSSIDYFSPKKISFERMWDDTDDKA